MIEDYAPVTHRVIDTEGHAQEFTHLAEAEIVADRLAKATGGLVHHSGSESFGITLSVSKPKPPPATRNAIL